MLAGGRQILQAAVCEETYYVSAQAVGIPEGEAHELLQQMTDRGMRPTTPRDYRNAWSWLLERYFADKA
jgi:hypothetical protein